MSIYRNIQGTSWWQNIATVLQCQERTHELPFLKDMGFEFRVRALPAGTLSGPRADGQEVLHQHTRPRKLTLSHRSKDTLHADTEENGQDRDSSVSFYENIL